MSDLQLVLLVLGVFIIVGVVVFNWWQERNIRTEAESRFQMPDRDILMDKEIAVSSKDKISEPAAIYQSNSSAEWEDDYQPAVSVSSNLPMPADDQSYRERIEPTFDDSWLRDELEESAPQTDSTVFSQQEPEIDHEDVPEPAIAKPEATTPAVQKGEEEPIALPDGVNQQIDLIALLYLPQPASGRALREFLLSLADIDKPIYAYGLDQDGIWHLLTREQESALFTRAICNVQLADRSGPISKDSLNRFQQTVDSMGAQLAAQIEWFGSGDPLRNAQELDQFCIEVDKMVGFHLVQGESGPFTGTKFRGLVEAGGLVLHEDGSFYHESGHEQATFSLIHQDSNPFSYEMLRTSVIRGVTFQLDIPRVKNCQEVFNHMVLMARQMEHSLNARLVDDNNRPLGDTQIEKIRQQLKVIHVKMVTRGIIPGSDDALRLFS